jgi:hypothetical protein
MEYGESCAVFMVHDVHMIDLVVRIVADRPYILVCDCLGPVHEVDVKFSRLF